MPLPFAGVADLFANGTPARSGDDPSYTRPLRNLRPRNIPS
ncbi:hypothetical protein [Nocardia jinanensis]|nr:hypothetical protein [Nocardia jinanensis]